MKAKVIFPFKDKATGKTFDVGAEIECTKERFAEIRKAGNYVVEVKEAKKEAKKEDK